MRRLTVFACAGGLLQGACLPADSRPVPAVVQVTASTSDPALNGFQTADGWSVQFSKLLISIGQARVEGDDCVDYADDGYTRILSGLVPGTQKVSELFGRGNCELAFAVTAPDDRPALGAGVSGSDRDDLLGGSRDVGMRRSVYAAGSAARAGVTVSFEFQTARTAPYWACWSSNQTQGKALQADQTLTTAISLAPEVLFLAQSTQDPANLRFQAFFDADAVYGNHDARITAEELALVPFDAIAVGGNYDLGASHLGTVQTLSDYVLGVNFPKLAQSLTDGTRCTTFQLVTE